MRATALQKNHVTRLDSVWDTDQTHCLVTQCFVLFCLMKFNLILFLNQNLFGKKKRQNRNGCLLFGHCLCRPHFSQLKRWHQNHNLIQTYPFHSLVLSNPKFPDKTRQPDKSVSWSLVLIFIPILRGTDWLVSDTTDTI